MLASWRALHVRESGAWLDVLPSTSLGLRMDDETVRIAIGLRLSLPLCSPHIPVVLVELRLMSTVFIDLAAVLVKAVTTDILLLMIFSIALLPLLRFLPVLNLPICRLMTLARWCHNGSLDQGQMPSMGRYMCRHICIIIPLVEAGSVADMAEERKRRKYILTLNGTLYSLQWRLKL